MDNYYKDKIGEEENDLCKDRAYADSYFALKLLIENQREFNEKMHLIFVDYKKLLIDWTMKNY